MPAGARHQDPYHELVPEPAAEHIQISLILLAVYPPAISDRYIIRSARIPAVTGQDMSVSVSVRVTRVK